ncbi:MAG: DUF58 domain-containing protein [Betaproteobacteria bacterium]|nr:DUF58 domain-containing protein [Betaproteobacteria bacterium]
MAPRADRGALRNWFYGHAPPKGGAVVLGHRRVYILPTRLGLLFAGTLAILLVGSINYAMSLGFALTFLLGGLGVASMVHTTRNPSQLAISAGRAEPVFAGEQALLRPALASQAPFDRPQILVRHVTSGAQHVAELGVRETNETVLAIPAPKHGWLPWGRLMLETRFPLGLFRAWSYIEPDARSLVYPRPVRSPLPPHAPDPQAGAARAQAAGNDDYSGLRAYQPSDSPRHVAWKTVARSGHMLTKQFAGDAAAELMLDWAQLPHGADVEERLSRLTGWVIAAERDGLRYGLRLPALEIPPNCGAPHRAACLKALALYGSGERE